MKLIKKNTLKNEARREERQVRCYACINGIVIPVL